ncbi:inactive serine/threonine-protein kinase TEX14 isoform X3 [Tupaia chinensis]|uniref:inactive serine/threonine-protein kinase TEX14 isoform X3 n=1 Tax=Tupaia chinensis TaxID=246437 RepID=UPI0003C91494|nr:inactive serine/threonine-protein kinase TEX14 isoform X3 [Tupaia chinensis]
MPATTSDLYSFCILAQEVFTGKLPWAGREGPEVKAKLEAGESPALDPLVPGLYQALVQAGLGLGPADRRGSLQNARYLLREAMAQDSTPAEWTTLSSAPPGSPPEKLYYEVAPGATSTPGPSVMPPGPLPAQALPCTPACRTQTPCQEQTQSSEELPPKPCRDRHCPQAGCPAGPRAL